MSKVQDKSVLVALYSLFILEFFCFFFYSRDLSAVSLRGVVNTGGTIIANNQIYEMPDVDNSLHDYEYISQFRQNSNYLELSEGAYETIGFANKLAVEVEKEGKSFSPPLPPLPKSTEASGIELETCTAYGVTTRNRGFTASEEHEYI